MFESLADWLSKVQVERVYDLFTLEEVREGSTTTNERCQKMERKGGKKEKK